MSDPLDERFRDFATGTPDMNPAAPAEIRRRGDRMRRRRTALTAAGAALAVALIAAPVAVLATGDDGRDTPGPARTPTSTVTDPPSEEPTATVAVDDPVVAQIPPGFPLDAGYPPQNGSDGSPVEVIDEPGYPGLDLCGATVWSPYEDAVLDLAGATYTGEAEDSRTRSLVVYDSLDGAAAALEAIRAGFADCPAEEVGGTEQVWEEVDSPFSEGNDDAAVFTHRFRTAGQFDVGLEVLQVLRVDNALFLDTNYGEGGGSPASIDAVLRSAADQAADVVTAMEQFALPAGEPGGGAVPGELPDDVLSAADLPTSPRLDPWRAATYPDLPVVACQPGVSFGGELVGQRAFTATLAPVDGPPSLTPAAEIRLAVYEYGTADDAAAAAAAVTGWFTDCDAPAQMDPSQMTRQGEVVAGPGGSRYATWVYGAADFCGGADGCDAAWFDRMGVVRSGDRIAVVTFRELGGPLEPDGLDATMTELLETLRRATR